MNLWGISDNLQLHELTCILPFEGSEHDLEVSELLSKEVNGFFAPRERCEWYSIACCVDARSSQFALSGCT